MPTALEVYSCISSRFQVRRDDLLAFAETGYSFEEWCSWGAFAACRAARWDAKPKPPYREHGVLDSRELGDLLVESGPGGGAVFIEFGLVHSETAEKWKNKLNWDTQKVQRIASAGYSRVQFLICASKPCAEPVDGPAWMLWLESLDVWQRAQLGSEYLDAGTKRLRWRAWEL
jgi:hypothetical protein